MMSLPKEPSNWALWLLAFFALVVIYTFENWVSGVTLGQIEASKSRQELEHRVTQVEDQSVFIRGQLAEMKEDLHGQFGELKDELRLIREHLDRTAAADKLAATAAAQNTRRK